MSIFSAASAIFDKPISFIEQAPPASPCKILKGKISYRDHASWSSFKKGSFSRNEEFFTMRYRFIKKSKKGGSQLLKKDLEFQPSISFGEYLSRVIEGVAVPSCRSLGFLITRK